MMGIDTQDDYEPLGHLGGYPIHVATLLAIIHTAMLVAWTLVISFGGEWLVRYVAFSSTMVLQGWVSQPFTYIFVHIPSSPFALIGFALEMYFGLFVIGREVEKFLGRRVFCYIYGGLTLVTPALLLACSFLSAFQIPLSGSGLLHFLIFVVFATIYPNTGVFFGIPSKWIVAVVAAGFGLFCLAYHQWALLVITWVSMLAAYYAARMAGVGDGFDLFQAIRERFSRPQPEFPSRPKTKSLSRPEPEPDSAMESVDSVLEKISKHGIGSLTSSERATLERARVTLLNRGKKDS